MDNENNGTSAIKKADSNSKKAGSNYSTFKGGTKSKGGTKRRQSNSYFVLIAGILLAVLIPTGTFAYIQWVYLPKLEDKNSNLSQEVNSWKLQSVEANDLLTTCKSELKSCNPEAPVLDEIVLESTRFDLDNDHYIDVPVDWTVKGYNVDFRYLSLAEQDERGIAEVNQGFWPIYDSSELVIANGANTITFWNYAQHISGPAGFMPSEFNQPDVSILVEPTADKAGVARYLDGGIHKYVRIIDNTDFGVDGGMYSSDAQYLFDSLPYGYEFVYSGSADYLEVADQVYMNACYNNSSGWCTELSMGEGL